MDTKALSTSDFVLLYALGHPRSHPHYKVMYIIIIYHLYFIQSDFLEFQLITTFINLIDFLQGFLISM